MLDFNRCNSLRLLLAVLIAGLAWTGEAQSQTALEREDYEYAKRLYNDRLYDLAGTQFLHFVDSYPGSPFSAECLFLAGESFRLAGSPRRARAAFSRLLVEYPNSPYVDDALFSLAAIHEQHEDWLTAARTLERVAGLAPGSDRLAEAYLRAGVLYRKAGELHRSALALERATEAGKAGIWAEKARVELARTRRAQGRPDLARRVLQDLAGRAQLDSVTAEGLLALASMRRVCWSGIAPRKSSRKWKNPPQSANSACEPGCNDSG